MYLHIFLALAFSVLMYLHICVCITVKDRCMGIAPSCICV